MLSALLVALSLALVPGEAEAFKGFKFPTHKKPSNNGFHKTTKTHTSRARCTAVSKTHNFSFSKSVHVRAGASARRARAARESAPKCELVRSSPPLTRAPAVQSPTCGSRPAASSPRAAT